VSDGKPRPMQASAAPARNFSLSLEDRLRAMAGGPRAYMRRRRRIEDLESEIVQDIVGLGEFDANSLPEWVRKKIDILNDLIDRHNRYFPIEANLPLDPRTGAMLELGRPWKPMARAVPWEFCRLARGRPRE
jgi:hypothetical protein